MCEGREGGRVTQSIYNPSLCLSSSGSLPWTHTSRDWRVAKGRAPSLQHHPPGQGSGGQRSGWPRGGKALVGLDALAHSFLSLCEILA